jgi:hypothetical protein
MARTITTTKVEGIEEIKRALGQLPARVEKKVISQSMRVGLKPMLARARELTPTGESGQLRRMVKLRAAKKRRRGLTAMNIQILTGPKADRGDPWWGALVELGHDFVVGGPKNRGGRVVGHFAGRHMMEQAFQQTATEANSTTCGLILVGISREVTALGRENGSK